MLTKYIKEDSLQNIKTFTYKGICESILYKYVLSDFAQFLVNHFPMWLAPNLITVVGFLFLISALVFNLFYNPGLDQDVPTWVLYYSGFCVLMYQTLDNCDGKQARRTGSASMLGMLLDHSIDGVVSQFMGLILASTFRLGYGIPQIYGWTFLANISYFCALYQQKHCGIFKLSKINAVDEGLPFMAFTIIATGYLGQSLWVTQVQILNMPVNQISLCFFHLVNLSQMGEFLLPGFQNLKSFPMIIKSLKLPLTYLLTLTLIALFASDWIYKHQLLLMFTLGFQWVKMNILYQVCMVSKQLNFSWLGIQLVLLLNVGSKYFNSTGDYFIEPHTFLWVTSIISFLAFFHCSVSLIIQLADLLGIRVFKITGTKKQ